MNKKQYAFGLILLFISPVLGFLGSLRKINTRYGKYILILFFGIYGATMLFPVGTDGYRHASNIANHYYGLGLGEFLKETKAIFLFRPEPETNDDFFLHFISYIASFFSSSAAGLYAIAGLIYGYFFVNGINKVYSLIRGKWDLVLLLLFLIFLFWKSFEGINTIRNHTGGWIFFNGAFSYFQTKDRKYILLILLAPVVHFGYFILTIPFYLIAIFGNWPKIYLLVFLSSFFLTPDINTIERYAKTTELGREKFNSYVKDDAYLEARSSKAGRQNKSFHVEYYFKGIKLLIQLLFIYAVIFFGYLKRKNHDYFLSSLASLALLLIAGANLSTFTSSLEKRFFLNAALYLLAYLIILYNENIAQKKTLSVYGYRTIVILGAPVIFLFVFTQLSLIGEYTGFKVLISPGIYPFLNGEEITIKEFIKQVFI
ncbi:EpsG family protein [Flavilitoribacter nigricans]|uniref:EpsG family protein n=1 Tax=Flavilitoribacter nigricans (strain ATCC 23147 / DSM 23189 / NBRC 102662 / NCIMB 1420 / SS-2) TaxID=1122177 RepID=A0A2D0MZ89_FLAN2|nr:EpsG family protein [Flavilitoribacter nigricans]PHN01490.1 hypothetical protein CRP01_36935 [Flavilitoribacter nigricans DSM 23189 = NBRC 102662]